MASPHSKRPLLQWNDVLVIAGIAILLAGLLIPAMLHARKGARRDQCADNLRRIGAALQGYHEANGHFPPGGSMSNELSWHVLVLPQLGRGALHGGFDLGNGPYHSTSVNHKNNPYGLVRVPEYLCPASALDRSLSFADAVGDVRTYTTHYYGIMGPRGTNPIGGAYRMSEAGPYAEQGLLCFETRKRLRDITDGASHTFVVGEISWGSANCYRTWVRGVNGPAMSGSKNVRWPIQGFFFRGTLAPDGNAGGFNDVSLGSEHPRGTHVLMGDGGVQFLSEMVDEVAYRSMASIDGGEREYRLE